MDGRDLRAASQGERRALLEQVLAHTVAPIHLTAVTRDRAVAAEWLTRFEGAGLDGVIAKPEHGTYKPGKRAMFKVKHARTADCVVAGFRWHKSGAGTVGSLLLGLYDGGGTLQHVGVTSAFTMATRKQLGSPTFQHGSCERNRSMTASRKSGCSSSKRTWLGDPAPPRSTLGSSRTCIG